MSLEVADEGRGFDAARIVPAMPDPLSLSGRGLALMSALMDELEVRADSGVRLRMCKRLPAA